MVPGLGFGMVHDELPPNAGRLVDVARRGRPRAPFNKLGVFDPDAVLESGIGHGRHVASPVGEIRLPERDELMLCHYKHLGFDRWVARDDAARFSARRAGPGRGSGHPLLHDRRTSGATSGPASSRSRASSAGPGFVPDEVAARPRWWDGLPRVSRR